jgi:SOS-response transcriptional repressor LexA
MKAKKALGEAIYEFLATYIAEKKKAPSQREIAQACGGISLSTVSYHLDALEAEGRILRAWYKSRSIRLLEPQAAPDELAEDVYLFIKTYFEREDIAPSQREIAAACHLSKTAVQVQLKRLETAGRIHLDEGHRGIQLC